MTGFTTQKMGSFVSQLNNDRTALNRRPPPDLGELLQAHEKSDNYWSSEFSNHLRDLDSRTKMCWREPLLQFILLVRQAKVLSIESEELEEVVEKLWEDHLGDDCPHPVALSNSSTRENLVDKTRRLLNKRDRVQTRDGVQTRRQGLQSLSAQVIHGSPQPQDENVEEVLRLLGEAYLDNNVWDKMLREYEKFLKKNPSPPPLAVILSIL